MGIVHFMTPEITVEDLATKLKSANPPKVLDVREPDETEAGKLPSSVTIPLGDLESRLSELDTNSDWVVHCRSGGRSAKATQLLNAKGYKARSLKGGLKAWAEAFDPDLNVI